MPKAAPSPRWFAGWRIAERPVQDDAADHGTAFGLDMSLSELAQEALPAPPVEPRRTWAQRLARRSAPSA